MDDKNYIKNNLDTVFEKFRDMIKVETVVGEAVHIGDAILVPFVDVSFGFCSGNLASNNDTAHQRSGGGGGAKMEPSAILVIKGDRVEMFSIKKDGYQSSAFQKLIAMAPEIIDKLKKDKYIYIKDDDVPENSTTEETEEPLKQDK